MKLGRSTNYARLKEDEAPQLHPLSFDGNKGDDEEDGNEHFYSSPIEDDVNDDNLGDALDRLLDSSSSVSPLNGKTQSLEQNEDELVDYNEEDDSYDILRNEEDKTTRAKIFAGDHTKVEAHDLAVVQRDVESGDEIVAQGASHGNEAHDNTHLLTEMRINNPEVKPVLTQKGLMDIIASQPQALMQKMEWEQKKHCYKEMLSGYGSPNGTSMNVGVELTALMLVSAVSEATQMINHLAQSEASDKLMKQAEQHRETLEKEFKLNMERMKAEHDRVINEAMKIRDNYARSALEGTKPFDWAIIS